MSGIRDQENLEKLRDRLYARNAKEVRVERHDLTKKKDNSEVPRTWSTADSTEKTEQNHYAPRQDVRADMAQDTAKTTPPSDASRGSHATESTPPRRYRWRIIGFSAAVFAIGLIFSSFYILFGLNEISGQNISVEVDAPRSIGAGETVPVDIAVHNRNPVPIQSATLVVEYPAGTRAADDTTEVLNSDRIPVDTIASGEVRQIPVRAIIFGETDQEKTINARLEYRVQGTNSTLERALDPIALQITSSPLVVQVDTIERVAAGQEFDINLTINSNAPSTLNNVLLTAQYPDGFDFTDATPDPVFGQNTWQFDSIPSNGSTTVRVTGGLAGSAEDEFVMEFGVGVPRSDNQFILDTAYATARTDFTIEEPFIDIELTANEESGTAVVLDSGQRSNFDMRITNTLDEPVYDLYATALLEGEAIDQNAIKVSNGFYNSNIETVRYDVTTLDELQELGPGESEVLSFSVRPAEVATGELSVDANVFARRVFDSEAQEQLVGSQRLVTQYSSTIESTAALQHNAGPFANGGPVPPEVGEPTTYTVVLSAEAGVNDLTETTLTTSLPTYVTWLDETDGDGQLSINPVNQEITWDIGSMQAGDTVEAAFQVELIPSQSQLGDVPVIINNQFIRARDQFTDAIIRNDAKKITTSLPRGEYGRDNGEVRSSE